MRLQHPRNRALLEPHPKLLVQIIRYRILVQSGSSLQQLFDGVDDIGSCDSGTTFGFWRVSTRGYALDYALFDVPHRDVGGVEDGSDGLAVGMAVGFEGAFDCAFD